MLMPKDSIVETCSGSSISKIIGVIPLSSQAARKSGSVSMQCSQEDDISIMTLSARHLARQSCTSKEPVLEINIFSKVSGTHVVTFPI